MFCLEINTKIKGANISGILFTEFSLLELLWNPGKFFQGIFVSWNKKILENSVLEENCPGIFSKIISQKNIFPGIYSSGIFHSWNFPFLEFCPGTFCSWNLISRNFLVTEKTWMKSKQCELWRNKPKVNLVNFTLERANPLEVG